MAKTPARKPTTNENAVLAAKLMAAHEKSQKASARVNLAHAQIEVKGKKVVYDYTKTGDPVMKVVDRKNGAKNE